MVLLVYHQVYWENVIKGIVAAVVSGHLADDVDAVMTEQRQEL